MREAARVPKRPIHRSAWKKRYSRKFAVASVPPSSAASAPERHGGTVLGSKRSYLVAFVAQLCSKALRLVTTLLPEKSSSIGAGPTEFRPNGVLGSCEDPSMARW